MRPLGRTRTRSLIYKRRTLLHGYLDKIGRQPKNCHQRFSRAETLGSVLKILNQEAERHQSLYPGAFVSPDPAIPDNPNSNAFLTSQPARHSAAINDTSLHELAHAGKDV